ncbi:MAG: MBOAT family protein [Bacteroidales bacterium]|nr:MBOAT family protein [Bacteroidales bacterium]
MLFNSIGFAIFFPIVFLLYWFAFNKKLQSQNILLLVASYFFYGSWDYRFLFLLVFSTLLDYFTGLKMYESENRRKKLFWFWLSVSVNLGFLGVFKYYNFFISSFSDALTGFGFQVNPWTIKVILPVGISFYTFHGLSYVIDIYYGKIKPVKNFVEYSVFVSFFPLLVAGPIERATHLLPQIQRERQFDYQKATDGLKQILWGLFKKIVIADNCAQYANQIFNNSASFGGSTLAIGAVLFAVQIYADFSGYSDIALGASRLLGIELLRNFAFPYFSRDIAEFWRRWHISLSSWFRDYLYIPLGGSKGGNWMKIRNTFIIFIVSGFWHGANWTFIVWGALNALYFLPVLLLNKNRINLEIVAIGKFFPSFRDIINIGLTFILTCIAWVFFRSIDIHHAINYLKGVFSKSIFSKPEIFPKQILFLVLILFSVEWIQRSKQHALQFDSKNLNPVLRWGIYYTIFFLIFWYFGTQQEFIYFQF